MEAKGEGRSPVLNWTFPVRLPYRTRFPWGLLSSLFFPLVAITLKMPAEGFEGQARAYLLLCRWSSGEGLPACMQMSPGLPLSVLSL